VVDEVLEAYSVGSPTDEAVRWTDLEPVQLALAGAGYRRRSLRKALISGDVEPYERDRQFRLIATLRRQARARGVPVLCVDTRKKERLGHLPRRGSCYSTDVRLGSAEPTVRAASAGGPLPAVHLQVASDQAPFVLSCRESLKRCHPRFAPDRPGSGTAHPHPHPNQPHGHATPARYPLRAGTKVF